MKLSYKILIILFNFLIIVNTTCNEIQVNKQNTELEYEDERLDKEIEDEENYNLNNLIDIYAKKLSPKEKEITVDKGNLLVKLLNVISEVFKQGKITYKQRKNIEQIIAQIKSLNSKSFKTVDQEQAEIEQTLIQTFFKELQEKAELDIIKVLIDLATLNREKLDLTFTPKKISHLLTLILEIVVPLVDLNPIIDKAITLTNDLNNKLKAQQISIN